MRIISNVLFFFAGVLLLLSIVTLDLSLRHLKNGEKIKSKKMGRLGMKFLGWSGGLFLASYLIALMSR